jgi:hypothetical protein
VRSPTSPGDCGHQATGKAGQGAGREPDAGCAERLIRRCDGSSVMQVGYVLRFGDQVARAAEQTTRPVTSAGCGDRAHCRLTEAALPTSWEAVYATQMGTFCAVRPWSVAGLPGPAGNSGVSGQNSRSVPRGGHRHPVLLRSCTPDRPGHGPKAAFTGAVRCHRAPSGFAGAAHPPLPYATARYERSPWPVGAS